MIAAAAAYVLAILVSYILPFLAMMGILVLIHEGGHFIAARMLGIPVTDFAIGMGPTLLKRTDASGCAWRLCAVPMGGFVRMRDDDGVADTAVQFRHRPVSHRTLVIAAGPLANFIVGFVLICSLYVGVGRAEFQPVAASVFPASPAAEAGIVTGDRIVSVDDEAVENFNDMIRLISTRAGHVTDLVIDRDGRHIHVTVTPRETAVQGGRAGRIGIKGTQTYRQLPLSEAAAQGSKDVVNLSVGIIQAVWETLTLRRPLSDMGGPIRIAEASGDAVKTGGWIAFITMAAILSVNLGVMNLLPIPVLDGGHLTLLAFEGARGKPPSPEFADRLFKGGAIALILFFVAVSGTDLASVVGRLGE